LLVELVELQIKVKKLDLALGFSHILFYNCSEVTLETISEKVKPNCEVNIIWQTTLGQVVKN
jgi:hypothetical protein